MIEHVESYLPLRFLNDLHPILDQIMLDQVFASGTHQSPYRRQNPLCCAHKQWRTQTAVQTVVACVLELLLPKTSAWKMEVKTERTTNYFCNWHSR